MKIIVTGGAGFIGANLCKELLGRPSVREVVVLDDLSTGSRKNLEGLDVNLIEGSILDRSTLAHCVEGAHSVVHLAARPSVPRSVSDPVASHEANSTGTLYVLDACRQNNVPVVLASSSSVYGPTKELPKHEELPTRPQSPYAASKLAAEAYALAYAASYGMPTLAFRFFNVYGPLQAANHAYAAVVPSFIDAALKGQPLTIHGDGRQSRDFTFVGTVSDVLADAAVRGIASPSPINLALGTRTTVLELVTKLGILLGKELDVEFVPSRVGDVRDSQAADMRLLELFPSPKQTTLEEGLQQTLDWFRTQTHYAPRQGMPKAVALSHQ